MSHLRSALVGRVIAQAVPEGVLMPVDRTVCASPSACRRAGSSKAKHASHARTRAASLFTPRRFRNGVSRHHTWLETGLQRTSDRACPLTHRRAGTSNRQAGTSTRFHEPASTSHPVDAGSSVPATQPPSHPATQPPSHPATQPPNHQPSSHKGGGECFLPNESAYNRGLPMRMR